MDNPLSRDPEFTLMKSLNIVTEDRDGMIRLSDKFSEFIQCFDEVIAIGPGAGLPENRRKSRLSACWELLKTWSPRLSDKERWEVALLLVSMMELRDEEGEKVNG